jgi:hypothetical protein
MAFLLIEDAVIPLHLDEKLLPNEVMSTLGDAWEDAFLPWAAMLLHKSNLRVRDERTGFWRQTGSGGRRLQRHWKRHRAGVS